MVTFNELGRYGRLGNQMFQIAGTIGIATYNGYEYAFPHWMNHDAKTRFGSDEDIDIQKHFANRLPYYDQDLPRLPDFFVHWGFHGLKYPDNVSFSGHMQSEKYFAHCADLIREVFKFKELVQPSDYTAVHIRMGDYGGDYHPICSRDYYFEAFRRMKGPYLIFSDDVERAKNYIGTTSGEGDMWHTGGTIEALKAMASCRAHIIANSTFSWWGAWLSGSHEVVAPSRWFGPAANLDPTDLYCKNWIVI